MQLMFINVSLSISCSVTFFVAVNQAFGNVVGVINSFPLEKVSLVAQLPSPK